MDDKHSEQWDVVDEAAELLREGDHEGAMHELRAVLDHDPSNPYAYYFLGAAHFERGEFDEARVAYAHAVDRAPTYLGALIGLGHSLRMTARYDEAIRVGRHALSLGKDASGDPDAHFLLGLCFAARSDRANAVRHLEAFIASNPEVEARYEAQALLETLTGRASPLDPTPTN